MHKTNHSTSAALMQTVGSIYFARSTETTERHRPALFFWPSLPRLLQLDSGGSAAGNLTGTTCQHQGRASIPGNAAKNISECVIASHWDGL